VTRYPGLKLSPYTEGTGNFDEPLPSNPKHIGVLAHLAVSLGLSACRQGIASASSQPRRPDQRAHQSSIISSRLGV